MNSSSVFLEKYHNREYISKYIDATTPKEIKPQNFNLDNYNNEILEEKYKKYKLYFETMYSGIDDNIKLDEEQIKVILSDEDYSLIIAGAGTGKTTTMAAKVKYLVDICNVNPQEILVMSYTKKATEELDKRIRLDFGIPAYVTTFHSLGLMYIRSIFKDKKCSVVDDNTKNKIFLEYLTTRLFPRKDSLEKLIQVFSQDNLVKLGEFFKKNYMNYDSYEKFFKAYKDYRISQITDLDSHIKMQLEHDYNQENIYTIKNELVKSKGEAMIANFLFMHNIPYDYEKVYPELLDNNKPYHPDFTIYLGSEEIYIEYFGLSEVEDGKYNRYKKNMLEKIKYHKAHHNKFIGLDYNEGQNLLSNLRTSLEYLGFKLEKIDSREIISKLLDRHSLGQVYSLRNLYFNCIEKIKSSVNRNFAETIIKNYLNDLINPDEKEISEIQYRFIWDFYKYYQKFLFSSPNEYKFDFPDMIYYANKYISRANDKELNFKYLVIDEYQDISQDKYTLVNNIIIKNHAKIVAVGDDWQSIYAFNGSKIGYIYNFQKYFPYAKILYISRTYRNSKELIDYSGKFVMKNPMQIKKELISSKSIDRPIQFIGFDDEVTKVKELIINIYLIHPDYKVLILARKNKNIKELFNDEDFRDNIGTKVTLAGFEDIKIEAMSIHKSKGLTYDEVIIIGLDRDFPIGNRSNFWMEELFRPKDNEEKFAYAEERRVFYVGLTRTKNHVYLLVNQDASLRSPFIDEMYQIIKKENNKF